MIKQREQLTLMYRAMVASAMPDACMPSHMPAPPIGRTIVVGAGKASAAMARTFERLYAGHASGTVVTQYGYEEPCRDIEILTANHPVPDESGLRAALRILDRVRGLRADDLVVALISGGGSSLLPLPADGLSLADEIVTNQILVKSGAAISEMNCVRKHISRIKGGRLAQAAAPARVLSLIISDIPNDDPSDVASGPTVADKSTFDDAMRVVESYKLDLPSTVIRHLELGEDETPKYLGNTQSVVIASGRSGIDAAAKEARRQHLTPLILNYEQEGDAKTVGLEHAQAALKWMKTATGPTVLLSGGETTVRVEPGSTGRGGRNTEYALALAMGLRGAKGIFALAASTDGKDGTGESAGAYVVPDALTLTDTDPTRALERHDTHSFFAAQGNAFRSEPTRTNINDFRAIILDPRET